MSHKFFDLTFTPSVKRAQEHFEKLEAVIERLKSELPRGNSQKT
jgi:hypothetical protein